MEGGEVGRLCSIPRRTTQWSRPRQWELGGRRVSSMARRLTAGVRLRKAHWKDMAGTDHCQYPPLLHRLDQEEGCYMEQDEKGAVTQVLNDYIRVFGSFDAQRVLPYYHEPLTSVQARGVAVLSTRAPAQSDRSSRACCAASRRPSRRTGRKRPGAVPGAF